MTRGSKVGLVVAGSFLALAGGSLAVRMLNREPEVTTDLAQQPPSATTEQQPAPQTPAPEATTNIQPVVPVVTTTASEPPPAPAPSWSPEPAPGVITQQPNNPPAPITTEVKPPEPSFPIITESPKPIETASPEPAPITNEAPKPVDNTPPPAPITPSNTETPKSIENPITPAPITPAPVESPKAVEEPKPQAPVANPETAAPTSVAQLSQPNRPEGGSPQPLPDTISKGVQATGVAKPATRPSSDSYLEEEYKIRGGENFNTVSKRFYYNEKYAQALEKYNRDYPLAPASMRQDPSKLTNGQTLWIPPIRILEKRYPDVIPDFRPVTSQSTSLPPQAQTPTWTTASSNSGAKPLSNSPSYKTYRVRDGGETMQDIARRTMGNTLAWSEIYRLNPSLNPSAATPIPAGTLLRLPSEAKVD